MQIRILQTPAELQEYDSWVRNHAHGNLWQSCAWKLYQESIGRKVRIYACFSENSTIDASALVVIDTTTGGLSTWEIPRGPLVSEKLKVESGKYQEFLQAIIKGAKGEKCLMFYLSPPSSLSTFHFQLSTSLRHVQPEATRVIDLTVSEADILAQMHPKGRYNIALARKHDVEVKEGSAHEIDAFYELLLGTGGRDGFKISQQSHYAHFLSDLEGSYLLLAKYQGKPVSGLIGTQWNGTAIYYYGASSYEHRSLMAPYLLQWEAIRRAKASGCARYDLLGISPENVGPNDPWQGITDFKRKFGGRVVTYPPEQMMVMRPLVKRVLEWKRRLIG